MSFCHMNERPGFFNGEKNVVAVAKGGKLTGDTIQKIGLANSVCVNTREGRQAVGVLIGA